MFPAPAVSVLPGNLLEMHVLGPHPRPAESGILEIETSNCVFIGPSSDSDAG